MQKSFIGADEVGVGDYFGGIVTCAAYIDNKILEKIKSLNIKDSKKLSNIQIIETAKKIIDIVPYEIKNIYPSEYNELYELYKNANIIKTYGHNFCIKKIMQRINDDGTIIVLDKYADYTNLNKYIKIIDKKDFLKIDILTTKAEEKYIAVAIASIIARYYFLKQITTISKKYKINLPLGYNKQNIDVAIKKLNNLLKTKFDSEKVNILKMHFKY